MAFKTGGAQANVGAPPLLIDWTVIIYPCLPRSRFSCVIESA